MEESYTSHSNPNPYRAKTLEMQSKDIPMAYLRVSQHGIFYLHNGWMVPRSQCLRRLVDQKYSGWLKRAFPILNRGTRHSYTRNQISKCDSNSNYPVIPIHFTPNQHGGGRGGRSRTLLYEESRACLEKSGHRKFYVV